MLGGHQAKAMPTEILTDPRMARCEALVSARARLVWPRCLPTTAPALIRPA